MTAVRILLVGAGAREHALAFKIKQSKLLKDLWVWPGNPCIAQLAKPLDLPASASFSDLVKACKTLQIDAVIVGPEKPLSEGLADTLLAAGIPTFGPCKQAAMLEASKAFSKEVMAAAGIPTASFELAKSRAECRDIAHRMLARDGAVVLKASGLAAGKGVFVCNSLGDVDQGLERLYSASLRESAEVVVVEQILRGTECSFFTLLGAQGPVSLGFAVDYKRLKAGDIGPNTGGMGCYAPVPWLPSNAEAEVNRLVVAPLLSELKKRGISYTGCLYVGLMWGASGPKVVEFNVRFGDPEAQVLAVQDARDWLAIMLAQVGLTKDLLGPVDLTRKAVAIVMASRGYPYGEVADADGVLPFSLLNDGTGSTHVFAASVKSAADGVSTGSGRVLTVTAHGATFAAARAVAQERVAAIAKIWPGCQWREDIGLAVVESGRSAP